MNQMISLGYLLLIRNLPRQIVSVIFFVFSDVLAPQRQIEERLCLFKVDFHVDDFPTIPPTVALVNSTQLSGGSLFLLF